jgi:hypothetical protein
LDSPTDIEEESFLNDKSILALLEEQRKAFEAGNKSALLRAAFLSFRFQVVGPQWVADGMLEVEQDNISGKCCDLNQAFGWGSGKKKSRSVLHRQAKNKSIILAKLMEHRLNGGSMNVDLAFRDIAVELGIPWRDVEDVYKRDGKFIKELPQNPQKGDGYAFGDCVIPLGRRYGRPIFGDTDK